MQITTTVLVIGSLGAGLTVGVPLGVASAMITIKRMGHRLTDAKQLARDIRDLEKRRHTTDLGRYLEPDGADPNRPRIRLQAAVTRVGRASTLRSLRERG